MNGLDFRGEKEGKKKKKKLLTRTILEPYDALCLDFRELRERQIKCARMSPSKYGIDYVTPKIALNVHGRRQV